MAQMPISKTNFIKLRPINCEINSVISKHNAKIHTFLLKLNKTIAINDKGNKMKLR